jgi:tetratricopeptide (TPR) repeat protein
MPAKIGCFIMVALLVVSGGCRTKSDTGAPTVKKLNAQLKQKFENPLAHYQLGKIYQQQGDWNKAASEYALAVQFDPVFWDAQASMIKVLRLAGEEQKADQTANTYIKGASGFAEDSLALGRAFEQQNIDDYALRAYEQALKLAPRSPVIYKQLGYYYLARNNNDMAKTYLTKSFQLDPYQADVAAELGKMGIRVQVLPPPSAKPAAKPAPKK